VTKFRSSLRTSVHWFVVEKKCPTSFTTSNRSEVHCEPVSPTSRPQLQSSTVTVTSITIMGAERLSLSVKSSSSRQNAVARNAAQSIGASVSLSSSLSSWRSEKKTIPKTVISRRPSWEQEADINSTRFRHNGGSQYREEWTQKSSSKGSNNYSQLILPPIQENSRGNTRSTRLRQGQNNNSIRVTPNYRSTKKKSLQSEEDPLCVKLSDACIMYHDNFLDVVTCRIFSLDDDSSYTSTSYYTVPTHDMAPLYTPPAYTLPTYYTAPAYYCTCVYFACLHYTSTHTTSRVLAH